LAAKDTERFVFFGLEWLVSKCVDIETKESYSRRMVLSCVAFLREDARIIHRAERYRGGDLRRGYTVTDHATVSRIIGSKCVFCSSNVQADFTKDFTADFTKDFTTDFTILGERTSLFEGERTSPTNGDKLLSTVEDAQADPSNRAGAKPGIVQGLSHVKSLEVLEDVEVSAPPLQALPSDMTVTEKPEVSAGQGQKVGELEGLSLEELIDVFTDGVFETTALVHYADSKKLYAALQQVISEREASTLDNRRSCKRLCERVNQILLSKNVQPPRGWVPVLKELKKGGDLLMPRKVGPLVYVPPVLSAEEKARELVKWEAILARPDIQQCESDRAYAEKRVAALR
jgi:hypothetical protein